MKKTLLTMACALMTLTAAAQTEKTYTDQLVVTVNDMQSEPMEAHVIVTDRGEGIIDFALKNFIMKSGAEEIPVGNIVITNLALTATEAGYQTFAYNGPLLITEGDLEGVDGWIGPTMLGEIPLALSGKITDEKLYVGIDIDLREKMGQMIRVDFGTDNFATALRPTFAAQEDGQPVRDLLGRTLPSARNLKAGIYLMGGRKVAVK